MVRFIGVRVASAVPVLGAVAVLVFILLRLTSGDPAAALAGPNATAPEIASIREHLGFDRPILEQFLTWIRSLLAGDLGASIQANIPVATLIAERLGPTVALSVSTIVVSVIIAVPLGVLAAWQRGTALDKSVMFISVLGFSLPTFVLGYIWIYFLAIQADLLPVQGYEPLSAGFMEFTRHLALPTLSLSSVYIPLIARMTRASLIDVLNEDYIRTARAKGMDEYTVLLRHGLMNAAGPVITIIGISLALLISGVVVTESVFNIPGLGRLTVDSVLARDYPAVQGLMIFFAFTYVVLNLLIDIMQAALDPTIRA